MGKLTCVNPTSVRELSIPDVGTFKLGVLLKDAYVQIQEFATKQQHLEAAWMACKYAVKGHQGLTFEDGADVPFKTEQDEKGRQVVSDETLQVYLSSGVMEPVAVECLPKAKSPKVKA